MKNLSNPPAPACQMTKSFRLSVCHSIQIPEADLKAQPDLTHLCDQIHGHDCQLSLTFRGPIDPISGWVIPLQGLDDFVRGEIVAAWHGRFLNDLFQPTSGEMILWEALKKMRAFEHFEKLHKISLQETRKNYFELRKSEWAFRKEFSNPGSKVQGEQSG